MDEAGTKSKAKAGRSAKAKRSSTNQRSGKQASTRKKTSSTKTKKQVSEETKTGITHSTGEDEEDTRIYNVVINHEEQYSIWFADRDPPLGWRTVGKEGLKTECLAYIDEVWTDMRPLSLRKKMEEDAKKRPQKKVRKQASSGSLAPRS